MDDLFSVRDKVVLVSGGSRGIGRTIAEAFHRAGARVVVSARREETLQATGLPFQICDVDDFGQIARLVDNVVRRFRRIDVLFNVAGINFRHAAESYPEDRLSEILNVNVRGSFLMAQAVGRIMVEQKRGKIINFGSLHTHESLAGASAYATSKGAIGSMTRALAVEWAAHHIQVNAIAPGLIRTDSNAALWQNPEITHWAEARTPAGRIGEPADLLGAAIFLASAASDFVTGQVIYVDGGFTAGSTWPLAVPR